MSMAQNPRRDYFMKQLYIAVVIKSFRARAFPGGKLGKSEIAAVVDLPFTEYSLKTWPQPRDPYAESPQWIRPEDPPHAMALAPSTRIVFRVDAVIQGESVILETKPDSLLNCLCEAVGTNMSAEGIVNLTLHINRAIQPHQAQAPIGTVRLVMSFGAPDPSRPSDKGSYRLPRNAPIPSLSFTRVPEPTGMSSVKVLHAYSGMIGKIFPNASPPLARLTHVIFARLARFHWDMNQEITPEDNPADDVLLQTKEFLLLLYNVPELHKLVPGRRCKVNRSWFYDIPSIDPSSLVQKIPTVADETVYDDMRRAILLEFYMVASFLDMCMSDHHELTYTSVLMRPWFGLEAFRRQRMLYELRVRTVFLLFKDWIIPPNTIDRTDMVRILLCFTRDEAGLPDDQRPFTITLAAAWGKESDAVQTIIRSEIKLSRSSEERDHFRRVFARLAQKAGRLPPGIMLVGVEKKEALATGGFADVYKGWWQGNDIVIKSGKALQAAPNDPVVRKQLFREVITWETVKHERILKFLGCADIPNLSPLCMISPFMAGKTASERCDIYASNRLSLSDRKRLLKQIAEGMAYLHDEKVIHGDLRGANVFLTTNDDVKIADFGLCVYATGVTQNYFSMRSGNTRWVAPELVSPSTVTESHLQERARLEQDNRRDPGKISLCRPTMPSDVYSFACTCIELLDGRVPYYEQETDAMVIRFVAIEGGRPRRPSEISTRKDDALWQLISRCWTPLTPVSGRPTFSEVHRCLNTIL